MSTNSLLLLCCTGLTRADPLYSLQSRNRTILCHKKSYYPNRIFLSFFFLIGFIPNVPLLMGKSVRKEIFIK